MTRLTWIGRLRIERAVWRLDWLVQDLPGRTRRGIRRDLRANLRAAAADVGAAQAIRNLGSLHRISADYLAAEYGEHGPRPDVVRGIVWAIVTEVVIAAIATVAFVAFAEGVSAAASGSTGTYTLDALAVLGFDGSVTTFEDGGSKVEMFIHPWVLSYPLVALVVGGRGWRYTAAWWRALRRPQAG